METNKSLDVSLTIITALLRDVSDAHGAVFNTRALRLTLKKVESRCMHEGIGFLTKTLPRLGKAFDKAISGNTPLNSIGEGYSFEALPGSKLPRFLGEFFSRVLQQDGTLQRVPCAASVEVIRAVCYLYYKYELPYTEQQEDEVIQRFKKTEEELPCPSYGSSSTNSGVPGPEPSTPYPETTFDKVAPEKRRVIRTARRLLVEVFAAFDPLDIFPRHGPGAVATRQRLSAKYLWKNVSRRITEKYPLDTYYYVNLEHVCDRLQELSCIDEESLPARVCLVPKDSRGPRLISCEPVDYQWIQQGLGRALARHLECIELTKFNIHFTDQLPNRFGALLGSKTGRYATLDLNEASDRISVDLVRCLFPPHICEYLEACRSCSTELPNGEVIKLKKFAPMGSALCFPILALTVWAILTAAAPDADTRSGILVYGDDVIVPTEFAGDAMEQLESFGLKINRDKSCTAGLFRESCGMDAFNGIDVTPVRLRTVWSHHRRADVYSSWVAYANSFYDKRYYRVYNKIVDMLTALYGPIPGMDLNLSCPSLRYVTEQVRPLPRRWNRHLQKWQYKVWDIRSPSVKQVTDGWSMLLRYFTESIGEQRPYTEGITAPEFETLWNRSPFSVSQYTSRSTSMLVKRWR